MEYNLNEINDTAKHTFIKWDSESDDPLKFIDGKGYSSTLEMLQKEIGGYVDVFGTPDLPGIDLWCDDEGLYKDTRPSVLIVDSKDNIVSVIKGNIIMAKVDEEGDTQPLDEEDLKMIGENLRGFNMVDEDGRMHSLMVVRSY